MCLVGILSIFMMAFRLLKLLLRVKGVQKKKWSRFTPILLALFVENDYGNVNGLCKWVIMFSKKYSAIKWSKMLIFICRMLHNFHSFLFLLSLRKALLMRNNVHHVTQSNRAPRRWPNLIGTSFEAANSLMRWDAAPSSLSLRKDLTYALAGD